MRICFGCKLTAVSGLQWYNYYSGYTNFRSRKIHRIHPLRLSSIPLTIRHLQIRERSNKSGNTRSGETTQNKVIFRARVGLKRMRVRDVIPFSVRAEGCGFGRCSRLWIVTFNSSPVQSYDRKGNFEDGMIPQETKKIMPSSRKRSAHPPP